MNLDGVCVPALGREPSVAPDPVDERTIVCTGVLLVRQTGAVLGGFRHRISNAKILVRPSRRLARFTTGHAVTLTWSPCRCVRRRLPDAIPIPHRNPEFWARGSHNLWRIAAGGLGGGRYSRATIGSVQYSVAGSGHPQKTIAPHRGNRRSRLGSRMCLVITPERRHLTVRAARAIAALLFDVREKLAGSQNMTERSHFARLQPVFRIGTAIRIENDGGEKRRIARVPLLEMVWLGESRRANRRLRPNLTSFRVDRRPAGGVCGRRRFRGQCPRDCPVT